MATSKRLHESASEVSELDGLLIAVLAYASGMLNA